MAIWTSAWKSSKQHSLAAVVQAALLSAFMPALAAGLLLWSTPAACGTWVSAAQHRWTCLLPGLLLVVPVAVAIVLTIVTLLNRRRSQTMPDGWLATILAAGMLTQVVLTGAYVVVAGPAYLGPLMAQAIFVPQPFVAGAVSASVFWMALHWR